MDELKGRFMVFCVICKRKNINKFEWWIKPPKEYEGPICQECVKKRKRRHKLG